MHYKTEEQSHLPNIGRTYEKYRIIQDQLYESDFD